MTWTLVLMIRPSAILNEYGRLIQFLRSNGMEGHIIRHLDLSAYVTTAEIIVTGVDREKAVAMQDAVPKLYKSVVSRAECAETLGMDVME